MSIASHKDTGKFFGWIFFIVLFFVVTTYLAATKVAKDKSFTLQQHLNRLDTNSQEAGKTWVDHQTLIKYQNMPAPEMSTGMYIERIVDLSTKNTNWAVDFYLWFRWSDSSLQKNVSFQIMDGQINSLEKIDSLYNEREAYELYRVNATITKFFNLTRYPRDNHMLTITIESNIYPRSRMQFVPDTISTTISSRVKLSGYTIKKSAFISKLHPYKSDFGDSRLKQQTVPIYDQATLLMEIYRTDWGLYFKMFQSLFASVAIALLVFFMKPDGEGRVGLGIGAFFAAVASSCLTNTELPGMGVLTLSDIVNIMGMITIFISVLASIISAHLASQDSDSSFVKRFDRTSLIILTLGYIGSNIIIANCA